MWYQEIQPRQIGAPYELPLLSNLAMKKINIVETEQNWKKIVSP